MTSGRNFQLGLLFAATIALGIPWAWRAVQAGERVPTQEHGARSAERPSPRPVHGQPSLAEPAADDLQRPHPITPLHERMAERRELLLALVGALEQRQYDRARDLLGQADVLGHADPESSAFASTVRGYRLILDCLAARTSAPDGAWELPGELTIASKKYLDEQRMSPRREVRRVCLEGRPFARKT
jgi:hypothetical protein